MPGATPHDTSGTWSTTSNPTSIAILIWRPLVVPPQWSPYHFARRFKETTGFSPHAYVLGRRVQHAARLLRQKLLSLKQIAAVCGFSSQAYFTTACRNQKGVTPAAFRRDQVF